MELKKTFIGYKVIDESVKKGGVIVVPWAQALQMGFKEGKCRVVKTEMDEPGVFIARSFTGTDEALVFSQEPYIDTDSGEWTNNGLIRAFCWGLFSRTTGLSLDRGDFGKFVLAPDAA